MTNRKGPDFQRSLLPALRAHYGGEDFVLSLGSQGAKDRGDFHIIGEPRFVIEAKNEARYAGRLSVWLAQAEVEAANAGKPHGVVVHKRAGKTAPELQYVTMTLGTFLALTG